MTSTGRTTTWRELTSSDPEHSAHHAHRWERLEAEGRDIDGEARLVDALSPRGARILDAGAGTGRTGAYLAARGHHVTGVDIDPYLVDYARAHHPEVDWHVGDLAAEEPSWPTGPYDVIVSAGNVLTFIEPAHRVRALRTLRTCLAEPADAPRPGRLIVGLGLDRGWDDDTFASDCARAGLSVQHRFSTWEADPFTRGRSGFLVAVLTAVTPPADPRGLPHTTPPADTRGLPHTARPAGRGEAASTPTTSPDTPRDDAPTSPDTHQEGR
ncbi:class I SAM-dependent methyltransferase [Corynebacterium bovis]|uniref:class I SAM-dependent methyltransferase n=2 Tax=Corynebacterium bovis TaxID=36808 RepID=UPI003139D4F3